MIELDAPKTCLCDPDINIIQLKIIPRLVPVDRRAYSKESDCYGIAAEDADNIRYNRKGRQHCYAGNKPRHIRYFTGFVASVSRASICSVTRIVPSSAAIAAPALPATIRLVSTGPSPVIESATTDPTRILHQIS